MDIGIQIFKENVRKKEQGIVYSFRFYTIF